MAPSVKGATGVPVQLRPLRAVAEVAVAVCLAAEVAAEVEPSQAEVPLPRAVAAEVAGRFGLPQVGMHLSPM